MTVGATEVAVGFTDEATVVMVQTPHLPDLLLSISLVE